MKLLAVYVARDSKLNLTHGLKTGIWGFKNHAAPDDLDELEPGDLILLATGYTGGSPRTQLEEWVKHKLQEIFVAPITAKPFESRVPEWPDERAMPESDRYVRRVRFDGSKVRRFSDVDLNNTNILSNSLSDDLRKSGSNAGRGYILDASTFSAIQNEARSPAEFALSPAQLQMLWARFRQRISGFIDFRNPGDIFVSRETAYKRRLLEKFQESLGREKLLALVDAGQGTVAVREIMRCLSSNIVSFHAWAPTFGETDPVICDVLREYLKATASPYQGPVSTRGIFKVSERHDLKPNWDALSIFLWALHPQEFFPIKISYYRELAAELEHKLPSGRPDPDALHQLLEFGRVFRQALEPQKPADWVDVQSFIWCVCPGSYETQAPSVGSTLPAQPKTAIYLETTKSSHFHGGPGWEFGTCLWSPSTRVDGVDEYAIMRAVRPDDLILNCEDSQIKGYSFAASSYHEIQGEPPQPGVWAKQKGFKSYYRIDLRDFIPLPNPIRISEFIDANKEAIRKEIDDTHPRHYPFTKWGDFPEVRSVTGGYLTVVTPHLYSLLRNAVDQQGTLHALADSLPAILRRYHDEQIVFVSSVQNRRYAIGSFDATGVYVERLDAGESQRVTFAQAERLIQRVKADGSRDFASLDDTAAVRNTILQAEPLGLSADQSRVNFLSDNPSRLENFQNVLAGMKRENRFYKPAMLLCVLDGIENGELFDNRITFDWIAPRFISKMTLLGETVTQREAAQPFYHLSTDLFWLHAVQDRENLMESGSDGPSAARSRIKYALLKNTYWNLLQDPASLTAVRRQLESLIMPTPDQLLSAAETAIKDTGFQHAPGLVGRFLSALAAKPFVILTGNSGTGKTQLAQLFAHWLSGDSTETKNRYAVVPVGADWTDNRSVVGFVNHLRKDGQQNLVYQSTPVLDLMLRATADSLRPYFLILDEMNLSHVERYFSDFLSAMESKKSIPLHNEIQPIQTPFGAIVPQAVVFPENLFVIGTVNVDETTYMFSPKVLDRANVIEFRIGGKQAEDFLSKTDTYLAATTPAVGAPTAFLDLSRRARGLAEPALPSPEGTALAECRTSLQNLFELLHGAHLEFAFRTIAEIMRYLHVDSQLAAEQSAWRWEACMDAQVLQKILPKLHGSRRRLEAILIALAIYCEKRDVEASRKLLQREAELSGYPPANSPNEVVFPLSHTKLLEMIEAVRRDQFVSFIQ